MNDLAAPAENPQGTSPVDASLLTDLARQPTSTAEKKAEISQRPSETRHENKKNTLAPGATFDRSKFTQMESTGIDTKEHHKKIHTLEKETVEFSIELQSQFDRFLTTHVENLLKITNPQILDNKTHLSEKMLLEALTTNHQPDKSKIANFLKTNEGWSIAEKLIEHQTALKLAAVGLEAAIDPQGKRVTRIDDHTVSLHADQGVLNHLLGEKLGHWLDERALNVAGRPRGDWRDKVSKGGFTAATSGLTGVVSGLGALITGNPAGALLGLGVPAAEGIAYTFRKGVTIDINQSVEAFKVIKQIPGEAEYIRAVLGIDINNLQLNAAGQIIETPGHTFIGRSMDAVKNEIYQGLFIRQEFYQALGVPPEAVDALPEQFLFQANPKSAEQTGVRLDQRIQELMDFNNPKVKALNRTDQLKRFFRQREKAMFEQLDIYSTKVMENTASTEAVTRIETKVARKSAGGEEIEERTNEITKRKGELEKEKGKLTTAHEAADEYGKAKTSFDETLEAYKKEFVVDVSAGRSIDEALERLNNLLYDEAVNNSIISKRIKLAENKETEYAKALKQARAALGKGKISEDSRSKHEAAAMKRVDDLFSARETLLANEEKKITDQITRLEELQTTKAASEKTLLEKNQKLLGFSRENLTTIYNNFDVLTKAMTGIGITEFQLFTLSIDEIMAEINRINLADPAKGWPAGVENNNPLKRRMIIDGITEAKARFKEQLDSEKPQRDADFTTLTGWGISEDQLRTIPRGQLLAMIHLKGATGGGQGWLLSDDVTRGIELDRSMYEAKNRMLLRYSALVNEQVTDYQTRIEAAQEEITSINFENDVDILTTIKDVMDRQGKVFEVAYQITSNREKYVDTGSIEVTDATYSQNEKDSGLSKGYWEMMDAVFGYKEKPDRGSYVLKIAKTLPPDALARQINNALKKAGLRNIPVAGADYSDLDKALKAFDKGLERRSVNGFETRRLFADIINNLRAQADAL